MFFLSGCEIRRDKLVYSKPVSIIFNILRFILWNFKLRKKLPTWPSVVSEFIIISMCCLNVLGTFKKKFSLVIVSSTTGNNKAIIFAVHILINLLCRKHMETDGLVPPHNGGRAEDNPMDVNGRGEGDKQPETQEELEELMQEAEKLLGSLAPHKDPKNSNALVQFCPRSVSSLVNSLNLNTSPTIPGVPYPAGNVIPSARTQSGSLPGINNGLATSAKDTGSGTSTDDGTSAGTGTGTGAGVGVGSGVGPGGGVTPSRINIQMSGKKRTRCDTGTSAGTGSHARIFPAVYANVHKTKEKNNP
jgi:hypothetical protein